MKESDVIDHDDDVLHEAHAARDERLHSFPPCTIMVLGKAGVGKSTLLNAVFGQELAATGTGAAVTKHLKAYRLPDTPVTIIDTRGIEVEDNYEAFLREVRDEVDRRASRGEQERVHVLWFCTGAGGARLEPIEEELLTALAVGPHAPLAAVVVVTKDTGGDEEVEYLNWLRSQDLPGEVVGVLAKAKRTRNGVEEPSGLDHLLAATRRCLDVGQRRAFDNAQRIDLAAKAAGADRVVDDYASSVPLRTSMLDALSGKDIGQAADQARRRITRMTGEIAAVFGGASVSQDTLSDLLKQALGGTRFSDIADTVANGLAMLAGLAASTGGPVGSRAAQALTKLAGGRAIGGGAKYIDAKMLQRSERKYTRAFGTAAVRTFSTVAEREHQGATVTAESLGRIFEREFERAAA